MAKLVVHYPFVPHYRVPIFNLLAEELEEELEIWSSVSAKDKYLKSDDFGWKFEHKKTIHILLRERFELEFGVFLRLIKTRPKFYIILANPNIITSWIYPICARFLGCKVLFWSHGLLQPASGFRRALLRFYYAIPHGFLLYGERAIPWMVELGLERRNLHPIYNSLDYPRQALERERIFSAGVNVPNDALNLVATGRLMRKLKLDLLLEYFARYIAENPNVNIRLTIVGDGPELGNLNTLAALLNIDAYVFFVGPVYDEAALAEIYCGASASVIMGVAGLAVMHSLAYGVPVITHNNLSKHCPEIEALLDNAAGIFFEDGNYDSFADALNSINNVPDRQEQAICAIEKKYTPKAQLGFIERALNVYR